MEMACCKKKNMLLKQHLKKFIFSLEVIFKCGFPSLHCDTSLPSFLHVDSAGQLMIELGLPGPG